MLLKIHETPPGDDWIGVAPSNIKYNEMHQYLHTYIHVGRERDPAVLCRKEEADKMVPQLIHRHASLLRSVVLLP